MNIFELYKNEDQHADLDSGKAIEHLSKAISFKTVSYVDTNKIDYDEFCKFHQFLKQEYPFIMNNSTYQEFDQSILITILGTDTSLKPALFMAHQDVVPIIEGSQTKWLHEPFSGEVDDGYIWGRGAIDIKNMLIGIMESAEYLLKKGKKFKRTIYLAFGQDEETLNTGAYNIGQYLKEKGVELEYVLDESGKVVDGEIYGVKNVKVGYIYLYEKGYADLKLVAHSSGGHSSNPFYGTSLGKLAKAISTICDYPFKAELPDCVKETLRTLSSYIEEEPLKSYCQNIEENEDKIIEYWLSNEELYNQIITTIAPTMITAGSPAGNVMPLDMEAVINFRLASGDSTDYLLDKCQELVGKEIDVEYVQCINASNPSRYDTLGYQALKKTLEYYFKDIIFVPSVCTTSTDAHNYECICDCCMRFGPFLEDEEIKASGMHGNNERISIKAYLQGIRVLIDLMDKTC